MTLEVWHDALTGAAILAVDPVGLQGALLRARAGPVSRRWCSLLRSYLPPTAPVRRLPAHITEDRLLGGLDLAATLRAGRPIAERGLLVEVDGGAVLIPMAERLGESTVGHLTSALDIGEVILERDGVAGRTASRFAVVALDEGIDEERVPSSLSDRLALHYDVDSVPPRWAEDVPPPFDVEDVEEARRLLPDVDGSDDLVEGFCRAAAALGIGSARAPLLALRVARAHAALHGRRSVDGEDARVAARAVLGPRALVAPEAEPEPEEPPPPEPRDREPETSLEEAEPNVGALEDLILEAAAAALPSGLLAALASGVTPRSSPPSSGPSGALRTSPLRGRPAGVRRAHPRSGGRLNVVETLRAASPWQRIRRPEGSSRVEVRQDDFRVTRFKKRSETLTIFTVDASGSSALQRLAEAKGAVEQVLAECYVRRDGVALISFRGKQADLLLSPTKSLVRAKRSLAELPGGGATPIAAGLDAARQLAEDARRRGRTPVVVVMTDGRANVARDGTTGREVGERDAMAAAAALRGAGIRALFVDTAPRPRPAARRLAEAMEALYLPLPRTDASGIARAVRARADEAS